MALDVTQMGLKVPNYIEVDLPAPPIGGKCWVLEQKGIFVLQRGPGTLRTIACAHAGTGTLQLYDGIPNDDGKFDRQVVEQPGYIGPGRQLYRAHPVVMGSWMLDAGFLYGLTAVHSGGQMAAPAVASIVWVAFRGRT